jgi:hypothetical protein
VSLEVALDALPRKVPARDATLDRLVRRYTSLSSVLDTLVNRRMVLLDPSRWDDTNDSYFLELYRAETNTASIVALCCTRATETYHHWRVFTQGSEGVCIEVDRQRLERALETMPNVIARPVEYLLVKDLEGFTTADLPRLPFAKRKGFRDEREWRVIGLCGDPTQKSLAVPIELEWINRLVVNPWMTPALVDNLRGLIKSIRDCRGVRVESSRLTNSRRWKSAGRNICSRIKSL